MEEPFVRGKVAPKGGPVDHTLEYALLIARVVSKWRTAR